MKQGQHLAGPVSFLFADHRSRTLRMMVAATPDNQLELNLTIEQDRYFAVNPKNYAFVADCAVH
jgi:hypothetical protein